MQRILVNVEGGGDHVLVSGEAGKRIYVRACALVLRDAAVVTVKSGTEAMTGPMHIWAGGSISPGWALRPWIACAVGEDLVIHLSTETQLGGVMAVQIL